MKRTTEIQGNPIIFVIIMVLVFNSIGLLIDRVDEILLPPNWFPFVCAWCLEELGLPMGEGSHGCCEKHARKLLEDYLKIKDERAHNGSKAEGKG